MSAGALCGVIRVASYVIYTLMTVLAVQTL